MPETKYNALVPVPEGSDWDGGQHRETEFASPEAKAAYDAEGLFDMAQTHLDKKLPTVQEVLDFSERNDDDLIALGTAIGTFRKGFIHGLKSKPNFEAFLDGLKLSDENREKLRAMLTPEAYRLSLQAYHETGGTVEPPTLDQIKAELMTWSVDCLRQECEMREQPTLVIISGKSFSDGIQAMNGNKHYQNAEGDQNDADVYNGSASPYAGAPKPKKGKVSIVDGVVHPEQLTGVSPRLGARREYLTEKYRAKGMRHIDGVEMETLLQRSMIEARDKDNNNLIVDNWESGDGTVTVINPSSLTESTLVAYAYFRSAGRQVNFFASPPDGEAEDARGRASVQVMEF